ncbi:MAG: tetratricopeptide repeat protein [Chthoniobacterales bacterium]
MTLRFSVSLLALITLPLVFAAPSSAQIPASAAAKASELFQAKKWPEAATAYEALVKAEPENAKAWQQLGMCRYSLGDFARAATALEKSVTLASDPFVLFNLACVYARLNEKDKAIAWLGEALAPEMKITTLLDLNDPDLASLQGDERFQEMQRVVDRAKRPCMYNAACRQFDFWIGEWDVFNPQGRKDGTSLIQSIAEGCGILENWSGQIGGSGKSINFYDAQAGKWYQNWIDAGGNVARYSGTFRDDALRFEGEPAAQQGKTLTRLTFFKIDANTVRQLSEKSDDGGKNWTVNYDYKYVRRTSAAEKRG